MSTSERQGGAAMTDPVKTPPKKPVQFGRIPYAVVDNGALAGLTEAGVKVYCVLCAHVNGRTWTAELGRDRLARLTGLKPYTTIVATKRLAQRGLVTIEEGGGRSRTNRYTVNPLATLGVCSAETPKPDTRKPPSPASETPKPGELNPLAGLTRTEKNRVQNRNSNRVGRQKATPDPRVKEFVQWFCEEYQRVKKRPYIVSHGKDQKIVKTLLQQLTVDQLKLATTAMLADPWGGPRASIGLLLSGLNQWLDGPSKTSAKSGKFLPAQPATTYDGLAQKFDKEAADGKRS